jgi:hypothetical protein
MEQLQRLASTIPSGRLSSSTTVPQWQVAVCFGRISVFLIFLIVGVERTLEDRGRACCVRAGYHAVLAVKDALADSRAASGGL